VRLWVRTNSVIGQGAPRARPNSFRARRNGGPGLVKADSDLHTGTTRENLRGEVAHAGVDVRACLKQRNALGFERDEARIFSSCVPASAGQSCTTSRRVPGPSGRGFRGRDHMGRSRRCSEYFEPSNAQLDGILPGVDPRSTRPQAATERSPSDSRPQFSHDSDRLALRRASSAARPACRVSGGRCSRALLPATAHSAFDGLPVRTHLRLAQSGHDTLPQMRLVG
jgi:hypothetical protein